MRFYRPEPQSIVEKTHLGSDKKAPVSFLNNTFFLVILAPARCDTGCPKAKIYVSSGCNRVKKALS